MEHVKLAHGLAAAGRMHHTASTFDDKPRRSGVRCWVLAAVIALTVTFVFVGITLWLGLSAATRITTTADTHSLRDLRTGTPAAPPHRRERPPPPPPQSHAAPAPAPAPAPAAPTPTAPKRRKGQVEKVQQPEMSGGDAGAIATPATPPTSTTTTTTSTSTTSTTTTSAPPNRVRPDRPQQQVSAPVAVQSAVDSLPAGRQPLIPPPTPPPPRVWSPMVLPPPAAPWSPPLDLLPPPPPPLAELPDADQDPMVAEAASAPEWRHAGAALDDPPQDVDDEPFRYDGAAPEEAESPVLIFVQDRLRALKDWLAASRAGQDWVDMVGAVNASLYRADPAPALRHLKAMYYNTTLSAADGDVPLATLVYPTDPAVLSNSSSLVSFGLLAFDLLLLRNVQLLARGEDGPAGQRAEQLMRDPEVRALSALFLPPQEVRQLVREGHDRGSSQLAERMRGDGDAASADSGEESSSEEVTLTAVLQEVGSFLSSGLRAVLNLGRAYRATVAGARRALERPQRRDDGAGGASGPTTPLDCLWTLYCRSLDKTAKLTGPYGFLAKLNGLGLRLLLGAVPVEKALDLLVREATVGWSGMDCNKLFPRCSAEDAVPVVLDTALGRTPSVRA